MKLCSTCACVHRQRCTTIRAKSECLLNSPHSWAHKCKKIQPKLQPIVGYSRDVGTRTKRQCMKREQCGAAFARVCVRPLAEGSAARRIAHTKPLATQNHLTLLISTSVCCRHSYCSYGARSIFVYLLVIGDGSFIRSFPTKLLFVSVFSCASCVCCVSHVYSVICFRFAECLLCVFIRTINIFFEKKIKETTTHTHLVYVTINVNRFWIANKLTGW